MLDLYSTILRQLLFEVSDTEIQDKAKSMNNDLDTQNDYFHLLKGLQKGDWDDDYMEDLYKNYYNEWSGKDIVKLIKELLKLKKFKYPQRIDYLDEFPEFL